MATGGTELMQQLMNGETAARYSKAAEGLRSKAAPVLHELIDPEGEVHLDHLSPISPAICCQATSGPATRASQGGFRGMCGLLCVLQKFALS